MLENQFIQFFGSLEEAKDAEPLKVVVGEKPTTIFFHGDAYDISAHKYSDDSHIDGFQLSMQDDGYNIIALFSAGQPLNALKNQEEGLIFYIVIEGDRADKRFSNPLILSKSTEGLSWIKYNCEEDCFGFPFNEVGGMASLYLPINLKNPQLVQDDKTYVKASGEVVVLFAKYYKEWEAESDYISEQMHDKICTALSCDNVYIDNVRLTKSDSYEIDWSNTIKKACGQKLAKATWKMRANVAERNSNC